MPWPNVTGLGGRIIPDSPAECGRIHWSELTGLSRDEEDDDDDLDKDDLDDEEDDF